MPIFKGLYKNLWCLNLNKMKVSCGKENCFFETKIRNNRDNGLIKVIVTGYLF